MSIFDDLFSPTEVKTTTVVDPYAANPDYLNDYYAGDTKDATNIINEAEKISNDLAKNPQEIIPLSQQEIDANKAIQTENTQGQGLVSQGAAGLSPAYTTANQQLDAASNIQGSADQAAAYLNQAGGYQDEWDYNTNLLHQAGNLAGLESSYANPYTEAVVNTTLAGMDRYTQEQQAARGASEAAVGGISSTRAAVSDAMAQSLASQDRAAMEAQLRSAGYDASKQYALDASGQLVEVGQAGLQGASDLTHLGIDMADATWGLQESASNLSSQLAMNRANLASQNNADYIANANAGMGLQDTASMWGGKTGETQRGIQQQRADANRNAPADALTWQSGIFNSTRQPTAPTTTTQTSTQPGASPIMQGIGAATSVAGVLV